MKDGKDKAPKQRAVDWGRLKERAKPNRRQIELHTVERRNSRKGRESREGCRKERERKTEGKEKSNERGHGMVTKPALT